MLAETQIAIKAADGSLTSVIKSLSLTGTVTKAFVVAHPVSLSIIGGAFLGISLCCIYKKCRKKNTTKQPANATSSPNRGIT